MKMITVRLEKLKELDNALHPNNIPVGYVTIRTISRDYFHPPILGMRFRIGTFFTSEVQEIIDDHTFRTHNSIYKFEILNEGQNE